MRTCTGNILTKPQTHWEVNPEERELKASEGDLSLALEDKLYL